MSLYELLHEVASRYLATLPEGEAKLAALRTLLNREEGAVAGLSVLELAGVFEVERVGRKPVVLGQGSQAAVFAGTYEGVPVAAKQCALPSHMEVLASLLGFPTLVRTLGVAEVLGVDGFLMELLNKIDNRTTQVNVDLACLAAALAFLHSVGLVHGDVKRSNLMRRPDGTLVLCDLASAHAVRGTVRGYTLRNAPPETLAAASPVDARSDVWAFGLAIYSLLSGSEPHEGLHEAEIAEKIRRGETPTLPTCEAWLSALYRDCTLSDPGKRPTMGQVLSRLVQNLSPPEKDRVKSLLLLEDPEVDFIEAVAPAVPVVPVAEAGKMRIFSSGKSLALLNAGWLVAKIVGAKPTSSSQVTIMVDYSGSMGGVRMSRVHAALRVLLPLLATLGIRAVIIPWNNRILPRLELPDLDMGDRTKVDQQVSTILSQISSPNGGTDIYRAVHAAILETEATPDANHYVLVLTDGDSQLPNPVLTRPGENPADLFNYLGTLLGPRPKVMVRLCGIPDARDDFLRGMATAMNTAAGREAVSAVTINHPEEMGRVVDFQQTGATTTSVRLISRTAEGAVETTLQSSYTESQPDKSLLVVVNVSGTTLPDQIDAVVLGETLQATGPMEDLIDVPPAPDASFANENQVQEFWRSLQETRRALSRALARAKVGSSKNQARRVASTFLQTQIDQIDSMLGQYRTIFDAASMASLESATQVRLSAIAQAGQVERLARLVGSARYRGQRHRALDRALQRAIDNYLDRVEELLALDDGNPLPCFLARVEADPVTMVQAQEACLLRGVVRVPGAEESKGESKSESKSESTENVPLVMDLRRVWETMWVGVGKPLNLEGLDTSDWTVDGRPLDEKNAPNMVIPLGGNLALAEVFASAINISGVLHALFKLHKFMAKMVVDLVLCGEVGVATDLIPTFVQMSGEATWMRGAVRDLSGPVWKRDQAGGLFAVPVLAAMISLPEFRAPTSTNALLWDALLRTINVRSLDDNPLAPSIVGELAFQNGSRVTNFTAASVGEIDARWLETVKLPRAVYTFFRLAGFVVDLPETPAIPAIPKCMVGEDGNLHLVPMVSGDVGLRALWLEALTNIRNAPVDVAGKRRSTELLVAREEERRTRARDIATINRERAELVSTGLGRVGLLVGFTGDPNAGKSTLLAKLLELLGALSPDSMARLRASAESFSRGADAAAWVSDVSPEERFEGTTMGLRYFDVRTPEGVAMCLMDTPGQPRMMGRAFRGLAAADLIVVVVSVHDLEKKGMLLAITMRFGQKPISKALIAVTHCDTLEDESRPGLEQLRQSTAKSNGRVLVVPVSAVARPETVQTLLDTMMRHATTRNLSAVASDSTRVLILDRQFVRGKWIYTVRVVSGSVSAGTLLRRYASTRCGDASKIPHLIKNGLSWSLPVIHTGAVCQVESVYLAGNDLGSTPLERGQIGTLTIRDHTLERGEIDSVLTTDELPSSLSEGVTMAFGRVVYANLRVTGSYGKTMRKPLWSRFTATFPGLEVPAVIVEIEEAPEQPKTFRAKLILESPAPFGMEHPFRIFTLRRSVPTDPGFLVFTCIVLRSLSETIEAQEVVRREQISLSAPNNQTP